LVRCGYPIVSEAAEIGPERNVVTILFWVSNDVCSNVPIPGQREVTVDIGSRKCQDESEGIVGITAAGTGTVLRPGAGRPFSIGISGMCTNESKNSTHEKPPSLASYDPASPVEHVEVRK